MANGTPDFRVRPRSISPTAFADVIQRRRQIENQQQQIAEKEKQNRFNRLVQALQFGAKGIAALVANTEKRKKNERTETLAQEVGKAFTPTAASSLFGTDIPVRPTPSQARQRDLAMALVRQDPSKAKDLVASQFGPGQRRAADTEIRTLEFADGTVRDVIVDKAKNKVFEFSGQEIPPEVLAKAQRGFAPQLAEDIEGRTQRVTRAGKATVIFGEEIKDKEGKVRRIQFTPAEQKTIISARKEFQSEDFVKKQGGTLKEVDKIRTLVENNPKGALGPLRTQVARVVAGEVGRLTDEDIKRNIPTPDIDANLREWMQNKTIGNLAPVSVERYLDLLNILQAKMATSLDQTLNDMVDNVVTFETTDASRQAIKKNIGRGLIPFIEKHKPKGQLSAEDEANQFLQGLQ